MSDSGITFVHSNRMERLADALATLTTTLAGPGPALPPTILVPGMGLANWLERTWARRSGIAFGLRFELPGRYLWGLARDVLGNVPESDPEAPGAMVLKLLSLFDRDGLETVPELHALVGDADARARLALADQVSRRFDRYLSHWPDLLRGWERAARPEQLPWQGRLWRRMRRDATLPHRGELLARLARHIAQGRAGALPEAVHLVGLPLMPGPQWQVFEALSSRLPVIVYLPDARLRLDDDGPGPDADAVPSYPARLSRLARGVLRMTLGSDRAPDVRDLSQQPTGDGRLARVQRALHDDDAEPRGSFAPDDDETLLVHAVAGRWREVEVLRDVLVAAFDRDRTLQLSDVVVMVPDPSQYAPLFDAVFRHEWPSHRIEHRVLDRGVRDEAGPLACLLDLLGLPETRITLPWLRALAGRAEARARLALAESEVHAAFDALRDAGLRWGLGAEDLVAHAGVPDESGTLAFASRRLLIGYAHGEGALAIEGVAPYAGIEGEAAQALGQVLELIGQVAELRAQLTRPRTAAQWSRVVLAAYDGLFADAGDGACEAGRDLLQSALQSLARDAVGAGDLPLSHEVLADLIDARLAAAGASDARGAVAVTGMVPLRGVPFRIVAVLGLAQGVFPRTDRPQPLDCVPEPRPGERNLPDDDRQAFLEAILSARDRLHLSYSALDPDTGLVLDPSPLLTGLLEWLGHDPAGERPAWWRTHPAAPYALDAGQAPVASHWRAAAHALAHPLPLPRFADVEDDASEGDAWSLEAWLGTLVHPARHWLRRAGVRAIDAGIDAWVERGELDPLPRASWTQRAFDWLQRDRCGSTVEVARQLVREGGMPAGAAGQAQAMLVADRAWALREEWQRQVAGLPADARMRVAFRVGGTTVEGWLAGVHGSRLVRLGTGRPNGRRLLQAWLESLALRASGIAIEDVVVIGWERDLVTWQLSLDDAADRALATAAEIALRARGEALPLFPESASAYAAAIAKGEAPDLAMIRARRTWTGGEAGGRGGETSWERGERESTEIATYVRDWPDPLAPPFDALALDLHGPRIAATRKGARR